MFAESQVKLLAVVLLERVLRHGGLKKLKRLCFCVLATLPALSGLAQVITTTRISTSSAGVEGNSESDAPVISNDGRFVAFASSASNLVEGDLNGNRDVFIKDVVTGQIELGSVWTDGTQTKGWAWNSALSADGRYLAFASWAPNWPKGGDVQVYVRDRIAATTTCISVSGDGVPGNGRSGQVAISSDGRYVGFVSTARNLAKAIYGHYYNVFVHDRITGHTKCISRSIHGYSGNHDSYRPHFSGDGRLVVFESYASDLIVGDRWDNQLRDVFLFDQADGSLKRISVDRRGYPLFGDNEKATMSADGRYIVFESSANLFGQPHGIHVYAKDLKTGWIEQVNATHGAGTDNPVYRDPVISADGRYVAFNDWSNKIVPNDFNGVEDVFIRDLAKRRTVRLSVSSGGIEGNRRSRFPAISADGSLVAYWSLSKNLVDNDNNECGDIFVARRN
jgi:Tol biopolymer transport system component